MRLLLGDCLELMKTIPDCSVDMILCDLPYGTTSCKWDSIIPLPELWAQYKRIIKPNAAIVLTAQTPFDKVLGCSNLDMLRYEWIWSKTQGTGSMNAKKMPLKKHENVLVFYKKLPVYNPQFSPGKPYKTVRKKVPLNSVYGKTSTHDDYVAVNSGFRYPVSLLSFGRDVGLHPTQKPVELMEYLIKTYTNPGAVVLDNCMGSGTTGVACVNTGREFIGIEKDPHYFAVASNRIANTTLPIAA